MSSVMPLEPISALFERNLTIRTVYGEPIRQGETTIIPVAKVAFGFGTGMNRGPMRGRFTAPSRSEGEPGVDFNARSGACVRAARTNGVAANHDHHAMILIRQMPTFKWGPIPRHGEQIVTKPGQAATDED